MAYNHKKIKKEIGVFLKQYKRKSGKNTPDPNDRSYDRKIEQKIKRMKPEKLHELIYDESIDDDSYK